MLEVVFSESVKASMLQAKNKDKNEVVNIGFSLDIGDVSEEIDGYGRKNVFRDIWNLDPDDSDGKKFFTNQRYDLEKLLSTVKEGKNIRVWTSSTPFSACGFAFVCYLLEEIDCHISVVSFPKYYHLSEDLLLSSVYWEGILPDDFHKFLEYEKEVSYIVKGVQVNLWKDLKEENVSLRALVNGKLISVPENFYDHIILKNIPEGDFSTVELIGKIVGEYELGVSDSWLAFRIRELIKENILQVVLDKKRSNPYDKILKRII